VLKGITIPNVFTPNGDGINDTWEITYLESYRDAVIQLYNRYGQLIFQSKGYNKPWDGTVNGKPVPFGTYYYVIDPKNGRKAITGFVDIIR
jgi:gliding motility-associated-like protein